MIVANSMAKYNFADYSNKNNKINREIKNQKLVKQDLPNHT